MTPDPVLQRLVDEAAVAAAAAASALDALRAYTASERPADDLVALRDAETEFGRSNDTLRRWAVEERLGEFVDGKWFLRRSLVLQFKRVGKMHTQSAEVTPPARSLF